MSRALNAFYRLPLNVIGPAFAVFALCFALVWRRWGSCRWFRRGCIALLLLWLYAALRLTLLDRAPGDGTLVILLPFYYLWEMHVTGNNELIRTTFMNVALFFPAGLLTAALLPREWSGRRKISVVIGLFLSLSVGIELVQLVWAMGRAETDDLVHNTIGALLGALPILREDRLFGSPGKTL